MTAAFINALHAEERAIIAELRASAPFQRMEGIQRLLALYGAQSSVAITIGPSAQNPSDRPAAPVVPIAAASSSSPAIHLSGPAPERPEATVTEAARPQPMLASAPASEPASVVSSVRAALLGIGKT